jgi:hypothetical protein
MHYLFTDGFKKSREYVLQNKKEFGLQIGNRGRDWFAHIDGDNIAISTGGARVLTLRPDRSATLHLHGQEYIDMNFRTLVETFLNHKGNIRLTTNQNKSGRQYTLTIGKVSAKTNYEVHIPNIENTTAKFEVKNLEVVEDTTRRKEWFDKIKVLRRTAKAAVRISAFTECQWKIWSEKTGHQWFHSSYVPVETQMKWVEEGDIATITSFAVACQETYYNRTQNNSLPWQAQAKAVEYFFEKMTKHFHKGNVALKEAA